MVDLVLSVLCSSLIFVIFKLFALLKVRTLAAITTNYIIACLCGLLLNPKTMGLSELPGQPWFFGAMLLGVLFILVFNIMAKSSQINGVGATSVATKMSLVLPVLFAVLYYKNVLSTLQVLGTLMALAAVYLTTAKENALKVANAHLWLPILVFLGSGIIDASIKFAQEGYLKDSDYALFSSTVFGAAAISGLVVMGFIGGKGSVALDYRSVLGGICLGIPNYFSIVFLLRALNHETLNSASVFTINNVAIVLFSTLLGILLFKEELGRRNWLGVGLSVISIVLVALF